MAEAQHERMDEILDRPGAADYLKLTVSTLEKMASRKTGPAYIKLSGRAVRYRRSDLDAWVEQHVVTPAS